MLYFYIYYVRTVIKTKNIKSRSLKSNKEGKRSVNHWSNLEILQNVIADVFNLVVKFYNKNVIHLHSYFFNKFAKFTNKSHYRTLNSFLFLFYF